MLHTWFVQGPPAVLVSAHVPHCEVGERAQKVLWHCASSPHAAPFASDPGFVAHALPKFCAMKSSQEMPGIAAAHDSVLAGVALVPGNENVCPHPSAKRVLHVPMSPKVACNPNGEQACTRLQNASAASAHAFAASALTVAPESPFDEPPSDPPPLPASPPEKAPLELDDEQPAARTSEKIAEVATSAPT